MRNCRIIAVCFTIVLIGITCCFLLYFNKLQSSEPCLSLSIGNSSEKILPWYNSQDQEYYVFLPSFAELKDISIQGCTLSNRNNTVIDSLYQNIIGDSNIVVSINNGQYPINFIQSSRIHTLFINLSEEEFEKTNHKKGYASPVCMRLVAPNGETSYCDSLYSTTIQSRGNSTWKKIKKPYTITLDKPDSLLGLGLSRKWVLLANAFDPSNMRNKIVYDFASLIFQNWSPKADYVDLYVNGIYQGLYLLSEQLEVSSHRLDIQSDNKFLFTITRKSKIDDDCFVYEFPMTYRLVQLVYPQTVTPETENEIIHHLNHLETTILDAVEHPYDDISTTIDVDSWAQRQLIDEIFENSDQGALSSYFYYVGDEENGKFYGGPIWDYDLTMGREIRNENPRVFITQNYPLDSSNTTFHIALMHNKGYQERLKALYRDQCRGKIQHIIDFGIDSLSDLISQSNQMNRIRWDSLLASNADFFRWNRWNILFSPVDPFLVSKPDFLKRYLMDRVGFLDSAWIYNIPTHTVKIQVNESSAGLYSIKDATLVSQLLSRSGITMDEHVIWKDRYNDKIYGVDSVIDSDACLAIISPDSLIWKLHQNKKPQNSWSKKNIIRAMLMPCLLVLLACFVFVDIKKNKQVRHE